MTSRLVQATGYMFSSGAGQWLIGTTGIFPRHNEVDADSLHTPCDLVTLTSRNGGLNLLVAHPDGDIALRPWHTNASNQWQSKARAWGLASLNLIQSDGTLIFENLSLPAWSAHGYRLAAIDENSTPPRAHSWAIDTQTDWVTQKQICCINTSDQDCEFRTINSDSSGSVIDTLLLEPGQSGYVSYDGITTTNPRMFLYYFRTSTSTWETAGTNVFTDIAPKIPGLAWSLYDTDTRPQLRILTGIRIPYNAF